MHKTSHPSPDVVASSRPDRGAFTLIELLVVISVVALLISILLPALASARMASKRIASLSQIRGITIALTNYATDNKQCMPYLRTKSWNGTLSAWEDNRWQGQWSRKLHESKYVSDLRSFWSPDRFVYGGPPYSRRTDANAKDHQYESVGYGLNQGVFGSTQYGHEFSGGDAPLRLDEAAAPPASDMLMLAESFSSDNSIGGLNGLFQIIAYRNASTADLRLYNYQGAVVSSWVDGSAAAIAKSDGVFVAGRVTVINANPSYQQVGRRQLAWDTSFASPGYEGPYKGYWMYNHADDPLYSTPWYVDWRTKWYRGLR
jgi:prepilin-type N-terminal cleavage/methylation domain-containing protein